MQGSPGFFGKGDACTQNCAPSPGAGIRNRISVPAVPWARARRQARGRFTVCEVFGGKRDQRNLENFTNCETSPLELNSGDQAQADYPVTRHLTLGASGRISMAPAEAAGQRAAQSSAASSEGHSRMVNPPSCSLILA